MTLEDKIYSLEEPNIVIGIGSTEPFFELREVLEKVETPFVNSNIENRINPRLIRANAKSIICIAMSYNKKFKGTMDKEIRGNMSVGSIGIDYHRLIYKKLDDFRNLLKLEGDIFVDTGDLVDREVAKRCGIGAIGKSGNLINAKLGSVIYIGYMLVDVQLKYKEITEYDFCKTCDNCIKACPTNAISTKGFEYKKCISYLTQKKELSEDERKLIKNQIYGCDICQNVCPCNKNVFYEELYNIDEFHPKIEDLLNMSNSIFNKTYKNRACGWRGKKILQRNAIITLGNSSCYSNSKMHILKNSLNDSREDIKDVSLWAINEIEKKRGTI